MQQMYKVYTSQAQLETLPAKRDNFSHMNRTKLFGESKYFLANRHSVFPCEQALRHLRATGTEGTEHPRP